MRWLGWVVLGLAACQPAPAPRAAGPTPGGIVFSVRARGPTALAGGGVVVDPGDACPGAEVRVVGAGLPPGEVVLQPGPAVAVRADGSFDQRVRLGAAGLLVRHGATGEEARIAFPACTPLPEPAGSRRPAFAIPPLGSGSGPGP